MEKLTVKHMVSWWKEFGVWRQYSGCIKDVGRISANNRWNSNPLWVTVNLENKN